MKPVRHARPLVLRVLPGRLKMAIFARWYRRTGSARASLYEAATLDVARHVTMELVPGDVISDSIAFTGVYEPRLTRRIHDLARRGGTLVDVGANLGYFSLVWAAVRPDNRVLAFEASPRNIGILRRNIARNGFERRIEVFPFAAGAVAGKAPFDLGPVDQTGWGGFAPSTTAASVEVDVVRIDDIARPGEVITLLKIDVEGAEAWALMGCEQLLKRRGVREIWYEQNKPRMRALGIPLDAAQAYLRSVGYHALARGDAGADVVEWSATPR